MGKSIYQLSSLDEYQAGDLLAVFDNSNFDSRKGSISLLQEYMQNNLSFGTIADLNIRLITEFTNNDFVNAVAEIGSTDTLLLVNEDATCTQTTTVPSNITVEVRNGKGITVSASRTLTFNGGFYAGRHSIFTLESGASVVFGDGSTCILFPEWWGAVSDDSTDCATAIQQTVNAATGKMILFGCGTYRVDVSSSPITLYSNMRISGRGRELTTIKVSNSIGNFERIFYSASAVTDLEVDNITFDGNISGNGGTVAVASGQRQRMFDFEAADNMRFHDNIFNYGGVHVLYLTNPIGKNLLVYDNEFYFEQSGASAYDNTAVYLSVDGMRISNNYFYYGNTDGFAVSAWEFHRSTGSATNNVVDGYNTMCSIVGEASGAVPIQHSYTVTGNTCYNAKQAIQLWALTGRKLQNVTISGNSLSFNQKTRDADRAEGIKFIISGATGDHENITISGNVIHFEEEDSGGRSPVGFSAVNHAGITVTPGGTVTGLNIIGNAIYNAPIKGIDVGSASTPSVKDIKIAENVIINSGANDHASWRAFCRAISITYNVENCIISDNMIADEFSTMRGYYSWYIDDVGGVGTLTNIRVLNNDVSALQGAYREGIISGVTDDEVYEKDWRIFYTEDDPPTSGSYDQGDIIICRAFSSGSPTMFKCHSSGSFGSLVGITVDGNFVALSEIDVNDSSDISFGDWVYFNSDTSTSRKVIGIIGNTLKLSASVTLTSGWSVDFYEPSTFLVPYGPGWSGKTEFYTGSVTLGNECLAYVSSSCTITLPAASTTLTGKTATIVNNVSGHGNVTISGISGVLGGSRVLYQRYSCASFACNGSAWHPIAEVRENVPFVNFSPNDTTPSVAYYENYKTSNTGATSVSQFDDGRPGQRIVVVINDANTTIDFTGSFLKGNNGADWSPSSGDHMTCVFDGTYWYCDVSNN